MKQSLRRNLTINIVAVLVGTVALLVIFSFGRAQVTVSDLTDRIVRSNASDINGRLANLTSEAERTGKTVAGLIAPRVEDDARPADASSFVANAAWLLEAMRAEPEFGAIRVTLEKTGEHVQVVQRPNGSLVVQMLRIQGGKRVREDFTPFGETLQILYSEEGTTVDNRKEPWYRSAKATAETVWSQAYLLRNVAGPTIPGVTCATPILARDGTLVGVASIDLTIGDLSRFIQKVRIGERGYAFLLELRRAESARILAHPNLNKLLIPSGGTTKLSTVDELGEPIVSQTAERLTSGDSPLLRSTTQIFRANSSGAVYVIGAARVQRSTGTVPNWVVCAVVPEEDFMGSVWRSALSVALISIGAVLVGVIVSLYIAQRVSKPLRALAVETERVRLFQLEPRPQTPSNIREIDALADSVESMKTGLRSFEKLVPADYARWLLSSQQEARLGGERRVVTTSFADLIGFTQLSQHLEPEALVEVLAEHLDELSREVLAAEGTIDKFNGDDIMAFWNAPVPNDDHAYLACVAALRGQDALDRLAVELKGRDMPALRAGVGIATGEVVVGNVGSRQRMNYTVIGDSVNVASRLQGLNRYYGTEVLINGRTFREAGDRIVARLVDWVALPGRDEELLAYELLALAEGCDPSLQRLAAAHNLAMTKYEAREFAEAARICREILLDRPGDSLVTRLRSFADRYAAEPPGPEWDPSERISPK